MSAILELLLIVGGALFTIVFVMPFLVAAIVYPVDAICRRPSLIGPLVALSLFGCKAADLETQEEKKPDKTPIEVSVQAASGSTGSTGSTGATGGTGPAIAPTGLVLNLDAAKANAGTGYTNCSAGAWTDSGPQNNPATVIGVTGCMAGTSGWSGDGTAANPYSLAFDGSDDKANNAGASGFVTGNGARSITAWIYRYPGDVTNGVGTVFGYGNEGTTDQAFGVGISDSRTLYTGAWDNDLESTSTISNNSWNHIAVTYDGSGSITAAAVKGYINGTGVTMQAAGNRSGQTMSTVGTPYTVGASSQAGYFFRGKIAEVQVYDRALTASEVKQNCQATVARYQGASCP